jgi:hypothetical protein
MGLLSRLFGKKSSSPRHAGHNMISLVALASTWRKRSVDEIRQDLDETFPGEFLPPRSEGNFVIEGPAEGASYCVQCTIPNYTGLFLIHNVPRQYSAFSDYLQHIKNPEMRRLADSQACWLSVDLIHRHTTETEEDAYRFIRRVLGKLAPEDTTLLIHPSQYHVARFTPKLRAILAAGGEPFGMA